MPSTFRGKSSCAPRRWTWCATPRIWRNFPANRRAVSSPAWRMTTPRSSRAWRANARSSNDATTSSCRPNRRARHAGPDGRSRDRRPRGSPRQKPPSGSSSSAAPKWSTSWPAAICTCGVLQTSSWRSSLSSAGHPNADARNDFGSASTILARSPCAPRNGLFPRSRNVLRLKRTRPAPSAEPLSEEERRFARGTRSLADLVAPAAVEIARDHVRLEYQYARVLAVVGYPRTVAPGWLSPLVDFVHPLELSIHIHPLDTGSVVKLLSHKLVQLQSSRLVDVRSGRLAD